VRLLLTEYAPQHIGHGDLFLAARLEVETRPLQHSLEPQGRLHVTVSPAGNRGVVGGLVDEKNCFRSVVSFALQRLQDFQDPLTLGVSSRWREEMTRGHEFMPRLERTANASFQAIFRGLT